MVGCIKRNVAKAEKGVGSTVDRLKGQHRTVQAREGVHKKRDPPMPATDTSSVDVELSASGCQVAVADIEQRRGTGHAGEAACAPAHREPAIGAMTRQTTTDVGAFIFTDSKGAVRTRDQIPDLCMRWTFLPMYVITLLAIFPWNDPSRR
jgi:hypothetical protein